MIDDLDRCQSRYVVDLLEGIQTLLSETPVLFVVVADSNWVNACYEDVYDKLEGRVRGPGKPLGTLFLEKAFRFSTPMPGIPEELKNSYWQHSGSLKAPRRTEFAVEALKKESNTGDGESCQLLHAFDGNSWIDPLTLWSPRRIGDRQIEWLIVLLDWIPDAEADKPAGDLESNVDYCEDYYTKPWTQKEESSQTFALLFWSCWSRKFAGNPQVLSGQRRLGSARAA